MLIYERMGKDINEADNIIRTLPEAERSEHLTALAGMIGYICSSFRLRSYVSIVS